jgi:hypothetical protein
MLDFALLERQIERQRRQVWRIRAMACAVVGVAVFSYAEIGMYAYGIPALQRRLLALLVAVPLSALILLVFHTVLQLSGKVAHAVLHPSAGGPPVVSTSAAEALFTQGKIDASIEAFDALRQIHGQAPDLLRREADLHLGRDGRPERARERALGGRICGRRSLGRASLRQRACDLASR